MKVEEIIGKILNIDSTTIKDETSPENTSEWDSFNGLLLVSELEKNFNVKFDIEEIIAVKNVGDIKSILKKHKVL
ncbi:MAG: acyl carrier protein [Candidatus Pacebacteria bacterium]|jgi:acyl carrier protein|nr:phosphopantetheine-binding protein [Parcubacteria group bacterium]MDP7367721.1 acyl carrier protein [Candidatus Paceibacterota bacterium]MDP7466465.1 acyl carrier protein [Candidatus Paceibacterota bacterium]|tara:strand:+ start:2319 stop:2543 length:225 start_codon:yes stop_codon:yes gene_type:complete